MKHARLLVEKKKINDESKPRKKGKGTIAAVSSSGLVPVAEGCPVIRLVVLLMT